jgi:hypothetical protein
MEWNPTEKLRMGSPCLTLIRARPHVFEALTGGARTGAAQPVERIDGAVAVRPIDRERLFVFDHREATGRDFRIHAA